MTKILFVIIGLFLGINTYSQNNLIQIESNISEYTLDSTLYSQIDFYYSNTSDDTYILWIEKDNVDSLSNNEKIRKHFFIKKGDMSLMQMIWDGNVASFVPGLFDCFMKVIKPKEQFIVSILKKGNTITNSDLIKSMNKQIIIVKSSEIKGMQIDTSIDLFNYNAKSLTILAEWLK